MRSTILVLGYFGYSPNQLDGQTVKTRNIYRLLETNIKDNGIKYFDTQIFKFKKLKLFHMVLQIMSCNILVYIPGDNSLNYFFPFIYLICKLKRIKILHFAVGGWLADYLQTKPVHRCFLKNVQHIFIESEQLKQKLFTEYKFTNVHTFPNFRMHNYYPSFPDDREELNVVFMSRITLEKGIDVVFRFAEYFHEKHNGNHRLKISFYGPIDKKDEEYFKYQLNKYRFITYKGIIEPDQIYYILNNYDIMVLPTRYDGEGFPGTIMDAYISGLPVIVSNWRYLSEYVDDGSSGYVFDLDTEYMFYHYIEKLYDDRFRLMEMKHNAHKKSLEYSHEFAWKIIENYVTP